MAKIIKETYVIHGMSCAGCEAVVEESLSKLTGIKEAKASFSHNLLTVVYDSESANFGKIQTELKKAGYTIKIKNDNQKKQKETMEKNLSTRQFIGIVVILLALYLMISISGGFNFIPEVTSSMGYGVLFLVGVFTSLHCVVMCGGINMSQCLPEKSTKVGSGSKLKPSLLYNLGRVISYTVIGGMIGALGSVVSFSGQARGLVAILSGIFMVIMGISMLGVFPWINKITPRLPRFIREKAGSAGRGKGPFIVGLFNGLMPCGPLQAMQLYALGTGSFVVGALSMFFFSLGTLPLMFGLGAIVTYMGSKFTKNMMRFSAALVVVLGIIMVGRGMVLSDITLPALTKTTGAVAAKPAETANNSEPKKEVLSGEIVDGVLKITSNLNYRGYPNITVQKGTPVEFNIQADSRMLNSCNNRLIIPEYGLQVALKPGDNIIEFTPTESGKFRYSCWMGMVTGRINVIE